MKCLYPLINRRSRVSVPNKLLLFNTMYRPTFTYGAPLIARSAATHRKRMQVHQNKILKLMLNKPRRFPTAALHDIARVDMIDDYLLRLRENFLTSCTNNIHEDIVHLATGLTWTFGSCVPPLQIIIIPPSFLHLTLALLPTRPLVLVHGCQLAVGERDLSLSRGICRTKFQLGFAFRLS